MENDTFLRACRNESTEYTPVWLMRQAGRYMKEYMALKEKYSFLEMCRTPEIACEVTMQPINAFDLDAAIIFADILLPLEGMGIGLHFAKNMGPVIENPVRTRADIDAIRIIEPEEDVPYLLKAIELVKTELNEKIPLIGFAGAPFTLASYIIEGGGSKNYVNAKSIMFGDPEYWHKLMDKIATLTGRYLNAQIDRGVNVVQLFDSWAGCLSPDDYVEFVLPYTKKVIDSVEGRVPVINFSTGTGTYLEILKQGGGDVIGLDWKVRLDESRERLGYDVAVQGNLDPTLLFSTPEVIKAKVREIIDQADGKPGHIFNLGHGIILGTPVDNVKMLVDYVHEYSRKG